MPRRVCYRMFTGIIEEVGKVVRVFPTRLCIKCDKVLEGTIVGDSISVNGVCLTVVDLKCGMFSADVMPETMRVTSLGHLKIGDNVNLERAMTIDKRIGGHIVTGHVDVVGRIIDMIHTGNAVVFSISVTSDVTRYIIKKGSVALDGISFTVVSVENDRFCVSIIPHTMNETNLKYKRVGDILNIECDVVGKYVEKFVCNNESGITYEFLKDNGF